MYLKSSKKKNNKYIKNPDDLQVGWVNCQKYQITINEDVSTVQCTMIGKLAKKEYFFTIGTTSLTVSYINHVILKQKNADNSLPVYTFDKYVIHAVVSQLASCGKQKLLFTALFAS